MQIYTGDESGLVKSILIPAKDSTREQRSKKQKTDGDGSEDSKSTPSNLTPSIKVFGKVDKTGTIQQMRWGVLGDNKYIVVARKNGKVQYIHPETGAVEREYIDEDVIPDKSTFVGLHADATYLVTCTSTGHVSYTSLSDYNTSKLNTTTCITSVPGPELSVMRVHPKHSNIFATGGKANDLKIFDANVIMQHKDAPSVETNNTKKGKKVKAIPGLIFQAKNVRNDMLDLEVPVWIRDLQFLNDNGTKLATATHYHQIRLYDTDGQQRRPVKDVDVGGKVPLTCLRLGMDANQLIYADTMNSLRTLDLAAGRPLAQFKGLTGAVTDIALAPGAAQDDVMLVSVSVDRFLRVHETKTAQRKCEHSVYLKQRLTCVLVDEDTVKDQDEEEAEEVDEEEQAMWEAMETVKDKEDHQKKRKHSTA